MSKKHIFLSISFIFLSFLAQAQVGINTNAANPDPSAMLDVTSTTKGVLVPRMTTAQRNAISNPVTGLLVFDTDLNQFAFFNGTDWTKVNTETDPKVGNLTLGMMPKWDGTTLVNSNIFQSGTNVGVNNVSPRYPMSVGPDFGNNISNIAAFNTTNNRAVLIGETTNNKGIMLGYDGNDIQGRSGTTVNSDLVLNKFGGNVGIGTATPSEKLDVDGKTKTTDFQMTNGATNGYVLQSDANGNAIWANPISSKIQDADTNTKIEVEKTTNDNQIRFSLDGTEYFKMNKGSLEVLNTGGSVFMGKEAGLDEIYAGGNRNVGLGFQAMKATQGSFNNVAVGSRALWLQADGSDNVAIGTDALRSNNNYFNTAIGSFAGAENTGSGNIFIGHHAGENELGSNKLYISNSNTNTPLIFGDFLTKKITINDSLQSKYFRLTNGASNGYILQSDANGRANWVNPSGVFSFSESDPKVGNLTTNYLSKWNGTSLTNTQIFDNGTNVGVGFNSGLVAKLAINGGAVIGSGYGNSTSPIDGLAVEGVLNVGMSSTQSGQEDAQMTSRGWFQRLLVLDGQLNSGTWLRMKNATGGANNFWDMVVTGTSNSEGSRNFIIRDNADTRFMIKEGGNVGIGTPSPNAKLDVEGNVNVSSLKSFGGIVVDADNSNTGNEVNRLNFGAVNSSEGIGSSRGGVNNLYGLDFYTNDQPRLAITNAGNLGIGTRIPTAKLEVVGATKTTNFQMTTGATNGYILKSDASGNASWVNPTTVFSFTETDPQVSSSTTHYVPKWNGTTLVDGLIYSSSTSVGIGNSSPSALLSIGQNFNTFNGSSIAHFNTTGIKPVLFADIDATTPANSKGIAIGRNGNIIQMYGGSPLNNVTTQPLLINPYGGNVGIGTYAPEQKLSVSDGMNIDQNGLNNGDITNTLTFGGTSGEGIGSKRTAGGNEFGLDFYTDNQNRMTISNTGNIGIGTITPTNKLEVSGTTKTTNLQMTNGATNGYVLKSDANGNASWVNPTTLSITETDPKIGTLTSNYLAKWNGTTLGNTQVFDNGASVGIGTNSPLQAKLVVSGNENIAFSSYGYLKSDGTIGTNSTGNSQNYSIYASNRIAASEFNAFSDKRIKNVIGISNSKNDLETLSKIKITDYKLIDTLSKGNKTYKKVIAQEVKEILPNAVSTMTDVIPNIYKKAEIKDGFITLKNHNLAVNDKVQLIFKDKKEIYKVLKINEQGFEIDCKENGDLFVFGKEVSDFHTVDYEALTTLNISATQELLKKIERLEAENKDLKTIIKNQNDTFKSEIENIKAELSKMNVPKQ